MYTRSKTSSSLSVKIRKIIQWLHLWPSIVSGIIVVFTAFTGTCIVYADELVDWSASDARYVIPGKDKIPMEKIMDIHKKTFPELEPSYFIFYNDPSRSLAINTFDPQNVAISMVYINPYTGEILKQDHTIHFFFIMAHLHADDIVLL